MFTAENWRTFLRLRLVPPICSMTKFYTNFLLYREPNIALLLGAPIGSYHFRFEFFCPAGDLSTSRIFQRIVRNYSPVLRMDRS
jgi:hypothetical protein